MNQRPKTSDAANRSGAILVCVLVCVGIASTIMLTSLSASLRARRQMRHEMQMEQTRWLVEAAMIRGLKGLREENNYQGEVWNVGAALSRYANAEVTISITHDGLDDGQTQLEVTAEIRGPDPLSLPTRRSARLVVDRSKQDSED